MSTLPDIDPAQAEVIDQRLGQGFAFLRDVLAHPDVLEKMPSGATLRHRDLTLDQDRVLVRLTAFRAPAMACWTAIMTGVDGPPRRRTDTNTWHVHQPHAGHVHLASGERVTFHADGETPDAALDALEAKVRHAAEVGTRPG